MATRILRAEARASQNLASSSGYGRRRFLHPSVARLAEPGRAGVGDPGDSGLSKPRRPSQIAPRASLPPSKVLPHHSPSVRHVGSLRQADCGVVRRVGRRQTWPKEAGAPLPPLPSSPRAAAGHPDGCRPGRAGRDPRAGFSSSSAAISVTKTEHGGELGFGHCLVRA